MRFSAICFLGRCLFILSSCGCTGAEIIRLTGPFTTFAQQPGERQHKYLNTIFLWIIAYSIWDIKWLMQIMPKSPASVIIKNIWGTASCYRHYTLQQICLHFLYITCADCFYILFSNTAVIGFYLFQCGIVSVSRVMLLLLWSIANQLQYLFNVIQLWQKLHCKNNHDRWGLQFSLQIIIQTAVSCFK